MPIQPDVSRFAAELQRWREYRRYSQQELALRADVSQRHLSFLETGKSRPSPEMIEHLCVVLGIPLRSRNALLNAAGFADAYSEEPLNGPALADVRQSLERLVAAHDPFPAYVVDRSWNLLIANDAAVGLTTALLSPDAAFELMGNVARLFFHPDGARSAVANWPQAAAVLLERLSSECAHHVDDPVLRALFDELMGYDGVAELTARDGYPSPDHFLTPIHVRTPTVDMRLYTTISVLAGPADVTLEELRLETLLPADTESEQSLRSLRP